MNNLIVAAVSAFKGETDKNGETPVILNVIAGTFPNRNVISGTIAKSLKIEEGHTYLMNVREIEANEFGRQFAYTKLSELRGMEIVETAQKIGEATIVNVLDKVAVKTDTFAGIKSEFE